MRILAYNCGHDGATALIENGRLVYALEAEKDDGMRHAWLTPTLFARSLECSGPPDVLAISGWLRALPGSAATDEASAALGRIEAGYFEEGPEGTNSAAMLFAGKKIKRFSSSHARSHIMGAYGMSPFPQGEPCYALVWEGSLGGLYYVTEKVEIRKIGTVLPSPGQKYALPYMLADPGVPKTDRNWIRLDDAGKMMALAAYGRRGAATAEEREAIDLLLALDVSAGFAMPYSPKELATDSPFYNIGVESQKFKDLAWQLSEALFERFHAFAKDHVTGQAPLLIAGGCGLNCEWNSRWRDCGLFRDVFVPPCANDSGVALGAAVDAMHHYSGRAKVDWNVYAGDEFVNDVAEWPGFVSSPLDLPEICRRLANGDVIAWVQGRYEMGPRALGNRSLLAAPFSTDTRNKLNRIKLREHYRPIAPICLEEDFSTHFEGAAPSPYMLYFHRVRSPQLAAITHVDGSARAQSINASENPPMCALLRQFREQTGCAVLCNTSLNFKGRGFVNHLSQLFALARERGIDGIVVGTRVWRPQP